jgi:hypothetical protein
MLVSRSASIAVTVCSGCWIGDPPDYGEPPQTPPILDAVRASPQTDRVHTYISGETVAVLVPFRSEDRGVAPEAHLFAEYHIDDKRVELGSDSRQVASDFTDVSREFSISWRTGSISLGCHRISLVATHSGNLREGNLPIDEADTDVIDWLVEITAVGAEPSAKLSECPSITDTDGSASR